MSKKSRKHTQHEETAPAEAITATALVDEPEASEPMAEEPAATAPQPKRRGRKPKAKQTAATTKQPGKRERETVLELEPADEIKSVRPGTQLANVLALTARPEGATAVELDRAIVSTAKSVKHYGIWALRYVLNKSKGYGFRTVLTEGEPARYRLVLPKGEELASLVTTHAGQDKRVPKAAVSKAKGAKKPKRHGTRAAVRT